MMVAGLVAWGWVSAPATAVYASRKSDREAGRVLFQEKGCSHCHGTDGVGGERGPSLLGVGRKLKEDAIRQQIVAGGGGMPAFADVLQPDEISRLVDWLKTQKSRKAPAHSPSAPKPAADANGSDDQK